MTDQKDTAVSTERLAEMLAGLEGVTPGPWGVWREPTFTQADAIRELTFQVESTPIADFAKAVYLLDANGKCPATTGCGASSAANADHIARCDPDTIRAILTELLSRRSTDGEAASKPLPMDTAPKDGSTLPLFVQFDGDSSVGAFEDADEGWTIGTNNLANTGEDEWEIVGWDWEQDTYRQARTAKPVGWLPFHPIPIEPVAVTDEMVERAISAIYGSRGVDGRVVTMNRLEAKATARLALTATLQVKP